MAKEEAKGRSRRNKEMGFGVTGEKGKLVSHGGGNGRE